MKRKIRTIVKSLEKGFYGFRVRKWRFTFLLMGILVLGGLFSLYAIPKESSPDIDFGIISVSTVYRGVNPTDIDNLITDKIENAVKDIQGVKKVSSTSAVGFGNTVIELDNDVEVSQALVDIKDAVDKVPLPSEAEDPMVTEISTDNELMYMVLLYGNMDTYSPLYLTEKANKLKSDLEGKGSINRIDIGGTTDGSASVRIGGGGSSNYDIVVNLDKNKVETLGLSLVQISQIIRNRNANQPLGNHNIGNLAYDFRIEGEISSLSELGNIPIPAGKGFVYLKDISEIKTVLKDESIKRLGAYQLSGQNYVSLSFNKSAGANLFSSAKASKELLDQEFQKIGYDGLEYTIISDMADMINDDYNALAKNGLQTVIFVFLVLLLFVGLKEAVIATISLPLAFFVTFIVLKSLGLSLNFLTNFSLIITFGIAIDTTIVIIEGAHEKLRQGFSPRHAVLLAVRDYKWALIAGTATTVVVFLPLLTLPGLMGEFLAYIPITIFVTLVAALIISLTLNSALFYKLSSSQKHFEEHGEDMDYMEASDKLLLESDRAQKTLLPPKKQNIKTKMLDFLNDGYAHRLDKIMTHSKSRLAAIGFSMGLFVLSLVVIAPQLGFTLFPDSDNGWMNVYVTAKKGTTKESMEQYLPRFENVLSSLPEMKAYNYEISNNQIGTSVELLKKNERKKNNMRDVFEIEKYLDNNLGFLRSEGLDVEVMALRDGPPGSKAIGINLVTNDNQNFKTLLAVAKDFENYLLNISGVKNVGTSSQESPGQFVFNLKKDKLSLLGVSPAEFYFELYAVTNSIAAGSLKGTYDDHDIKLQYADFADGITPSEINNLQVTTSAGVLNLGDISNYDYQEAIAQISREDGDIQVAVSADLDESSSVPSSQIQKELFSFAEKYNYPDGISYQAGGETEENADLIQAMGSAFIIALLLIFGILVLQFNSFTQPLIIMFSILMGFFGANVGLLVTGNPYSLMFGIGFIALTGIVVNDAIVFLDRTNSNIRRGMTQKQAVVETGKSRLNPILVTTITTVVGLLSITSDPLWEPLAVTIMFGLVAGSGMTLFVIPALFYDRHKIIHIVKRAILHPLLVVVSFFVIIGIVISLLYLFGIKIPFVVVKPGLAVFVLGYISYNIYAQHKYGQSFVRKILGLQIKTLSGKALSKKLLLHRLLLKTLFLIGPMLIGFMIGLPLKFLAPAYAGMISGAVTALGYLALISWQIYYYRTGKNNQMIHDGIVGVEVVDSQLLEYEKDEE